MSEQQAPGKRNPELSADLFVSTALRLAEQSGGIPKLSLRNLGKALDVDATAVYRYFPNKAALVDAMMKRLMYDFMPSQEELDGDWRVRLTALARRAYVVISTYPSLTIHMPSSAYTRSPIGDQLTEMGYAALREAGLSDAHIVLFHETLYTFALGMGQVGAQFPGDLDDERRQIHDHVTRIPAEDFPNMHRLAHLMVADNEAIFQLGLEVILNQIESYASGITDSTNNQSKGAAS